jgi:predicted Zn-dependent peptidase
MKKQALILCLFVFSAILFAAENYQVKTKQDSKGNTFQFVENDPFNVREYTLENGLKIFLSENKDKPEISTMIAVKAGSTYDPKDNTGLAHYLEHLMFKGTDEIATSNWAEEKKLLDQISAKFEEHKFEQDPEMKKAIYAEIDSLSQVASAYAIPNELDKIMSSIGAKGTNAFTSTEQTVYLNTIPSNQLDRWITIERERFSQLVLRLFHTELETVYEEFNTTQSNDQRQVLTTLNKLLFPDHPYGTQTTIGNPEHLKNPSMVNIHEYWNKYYVANNMALILVGDLDPAETFSKIKKSFSTLRTNPNLEHPKFDTIQPLNSIVEKDVYGPSAESVALGFVIESETNDESIKAELISSILYNGKAGLLDLNLNQTRKVAMSYCSTSFNKDAGEFIFMASPQQNQTLEEAKDLLITELDKIKQGEFDESLIQSIINNRKRAELQKIEYNYYHWFVLKSFIGEVPWSETLSRLEKMETITKQDLIDYANKNLKNYAVVYKRQGENKNIVRVEKPQITPIQINRTAQSQFFSKIQDIPENKLEPQFLDYDKLVEKKKLRGAKFNYIQNENNELANLHIIMNMGSYNNKLLPLAFDFFKYLGTDQYPAPVLAKKYYDLGLSAYATTDTEVAYFSVYGLDSTMNEGLELLLHNIRNLQPNDMAFKMFIASIKKERDNEKLSDRDILSKTLSIAKYGLDNPTRYHLTNEELDALTAEQLVNELKNALNYEQIVFYYGPRSFKQAYKDVKKRYQPSKKLQETPVLKKFPESGETGKVYFANYDKVQSSIYMISQDDMYSEDLDPYCRLMNSFYGAGLSSVVFQEIREAKGLVYSAYSFLNMPGDKEKHHYLHASMETQPDKVDVAIQEMIRILNEMPEAKHQFEVAKQSVLKNIESTRVTKSNIFWNYYGKLRSDRSANYDEKTYNAIKNISYEDFKQFFNEHVAGKKFNFVVVSKKENTDFEVLKKYGEIEEIDIDQIFNY